MAKGILPSTDFLREFPSRARSLFDLKTFHALRDLHHSSEAKTAHAADPATKSSQWLAWVKKHSEKHAVSNNSSFFADLKTIAEIEVAKAEEAANLIKTGQIPSELKNLEPSKILAELTSRETLKELRNQTGNKVAMFGWIAQSVLSTLGSLISCFVQPHVFWTNLGQTMLSGAQTLISMHPSLQNAGLQFASYGALSVLSRPILGILSKLDNLGRAA